MCGTLYPIVFLLFAIRHRVETHLQQQQYLYLNRSCLLSGMVYLIFVVKSPFSAWGLLWTCAAKIPKKIPARNTGASTLPHHVRMMRGTALPGTAAVQQYFVHVQVWWKTKDKFPSIHGMYNGSTALSDNLCTSFKFHGKPVAPVMLLLNQLLFSLSFTTDYRSCCGWPVISVSYQILVLCIPQDIPGASTRPHQHPYWYQCSIHQQRHPTSVSTVV